MNVRERSRKRSRKPAFRPAGISSRFEENSRFIEKVAQKPLPHRPKKKKSKEPRERVSLVSLFPGLERVADSLRRSRGTERPILSFALSAIPLTALFVVVLGVFLLLSSQGGSLDWIGREVVNLDHSPRSNSLANYAGINLGENTGEEAQSFPIELIETFAWQNYTVQRGDSVSRIAANFSLSMDAVIASNGISNARSLREGEVLRIPNMDGIPYTVKSGDSLSGISSAMGVPLEAILDANDIQSDRITPGAILFIPGARMQRDDLRMALGELFVHPVRAARLSSPFGWRYDPFGSGVRLHHNGIDLAAPTGTPVVAAREGTVSAVGFDRLYGNYLIISHPGGEFQTMYAHLHTVSVRTGDQVRQGVQIGTVGSTGRSTGSHLHFSIFRNGRAVNPLDLIGPQR